MKEIQFDTPIKEHNTKRPVRSVGSKSAPTIRTFRADVEELIEEKGTTKAQVVMAETARREARGERRVLREDNDDSHLGRIIFLLLLVLAFGIGIGAYALIGTKYTLPFLNSATTTPEAPVTTPEDLGILITDSPREQILADISIAFGKTSLPAGEKRRINFSTKDAGGNSQSATITEFMNGVLVRTANHNLARSLDPQFTYEILSGTTLSGVLTMPTRFYAESFATMLDWENTIARDLIPVVNAWYDRDLLKKLTNVPFKDERSGNMDIRVLYDETGSSILAYGFSQKKTLVITGNREALLSTLIALSQSK